MIDIVRVIKLAVREIRFRPWSFFAGVVAISFGVLLSVLFYTSGKNSQNETRALTLELGFNLRIIPASTDMDKFWVNGYPNRTMSEDAITTFMESGNFSFAHLTAILTTPLNIDGASALLTGLSPKEMEPSGKKKKKMIFSVPKQSAIVGYSLAKKSGYKRGDTIDIRGEQFTIAQTLIESGTTDDATIYLDLEDAQRVLNRRGEINEIRAINCMCVLNREGVDPIQLIRDELAKVLPSAIAIRKEDIAKARERQRIMMGNYFNMVLPMVLLAMFIWIVVLFFLNTNQRRSEIGVLRSMGYSTITVAAIIFTRAKIMGILGALIGYFAGTWLAISRGSEIFVATAKAVKPMPELLLYAAIAAPLIAVLASALPILRAVTEETTKSLRQR